MVEKVQKFGYVQPKRVLFIWNYALCLEIRIFLPSPCSARSERMAWKDALLGGQLPYTVSPLQPAGTRHKHF